MLIGARLLKPWTNFEKFIICQRNCDEEVNICTHNSKSSFLTSEGMCIKFIEYFSEPNPIFYRVSKVKHTYY
jgi:hypothetical protein